MNKILPDNRLGGGSPVEQARIVMIKLLDTFVHICEENNLQYWLEGGTLLGAVRHKGFIPWDDDIDVAMPMKDYKKFLKIVKREICSDIFVMDRRWDKAYPFNFFKIVDAYSTYISKHNRIELPEMGIYLDVFPMVDYPRFLSSEKLIMWTKRVEHLFVKSIFSRQEISHCKNKLTIHFLNKCIKHFYLIARIFLHKAIFSFMNILSFGKQVFYSNTIEHNGYHILHKREHLYPLGWVEFEGKQYYAPRNTDQYLKDLYKDYTKIPPKEKQVFHHKEIFPCKKSTYPLAKEWPDA
jgi:lipopolysaccharide cholinephosphotransferase